MRKKNSSNSRPASTRKTAMSRLTVNTISPIRVMAAISTAPVLASGSATWDSSCMKPPTMKVGEKGAEHAPLASDGWMGDHGAHLLAAEPASGHEGENGEREGDGQDVGVDALEHLL